MSRIGRQPIPLPTGVSYELSADRIKISGSKGALSERLMPGLAIEQRENELIVTQLEQTPETNRAFGLQRTLVANMVIGVSAGFERRLEINGVGFRAAIAGNVITLSLGFSHPVLVTLPEGITAAIEKNQIIISGFDKQLVGQVAANIRALKKPEPYKGKGIKYIEERIKRKAGKTATKG